MYYKKPGFRRAFYFLTICKSVFCTRLLNKIELQLRRTFQLQCYWEQFLHAHYDLPELPILLSYSQSHFH